MNPVGEFQAFSPTHAITLLVCIVITTTCLLLGRRAINAGDDRTVARTLGVIGIFVNAWSWIFWLSPDRLDISKSIPMELCDMACIVAAISMLSHQRIFATLTVFWGFGLTTQAFITPIVTEPFPSERFLLFWALHLFIVTTALYHSCVRKYRPDFADLKRTIGLTVIWVACMFVFNIIFNANYGFVGNTETARPTIVSLLGPWPLRAFLLCTIVTVWLWILWLLLRRRTS
jgi:hypothetical integral membrane protein (TIGR02206 family)